MKRRHLAFALACALTAQLAGDQPAWRSSALEYNGPWWLSVGTAERAGFIDGYRDCYEYEFRGPERFSCGTDTYTTAITHFYSRGTSVERATFVGQALSKLKDAPGLKLTVPGASQPREPHGGKDGLYWMQLSVAGGGGQVGFVEGYIACHARLNNNKGGTFSKTAADYVKSISDWYRFDRETGDIDATRQPTFVADALFHFKDQHVPGR